MSNTNGDRELKGLKELYGAVGITTDAPGQTLIRIAKATLPFGCKPSATPVLLVLQEGQRPVLYVKPGVMLSNGAAPRSTSSVQVAGEEWMQFSYAFQWEESNTLVQFVETSLRRFAKSE